MISFFLNLIFGLFKIIKDSRTSGKLETIIFWVRIKILSIYQKSNQLRKINFRGCEINYFSALSLCYLVEEIFIHHIYYFKSENKNPFIIDAGSNIGLAVIYFKLLYPEASVLGFEADPSTYKLCQKNMAANHFTDVDIKNVGLWNEKSNLRFFVQRDKTASLNQGFFAEATLTESIEVPTEKLSTFIVQPVDFLKMDIEGAEAKVFSDLSDSKALDQVRQMCIECHLLKKQTDNLQFLLKILDHFQFSIKLGTHTLVNLEFNQPQDCMIYARRNS